MFKRFEISTNRILYLTSLLYFMCGFVSSINYILIPYLKQLFNLSYVAAIYVQLVFYITAFVFSIPSARLISFIGYKLGMIVSLAIMSIGYLLFFLAAHFFSYENFLIGFFVVACGTTLLQVALNTYVAIIGDSQKAASRLSISAALSALGASCAAPIAALLILSTSTNNNSFTQTFHISAHPAQIPYLALCLLLFILVIIISIFNYPKPLQESSFLTTPPENDDKNIGQYTHLWLGALAYFCYLGAEVSIASFLVNFITSPEISNFSLFKAGSFVSIYWISSMLGRVVGFFILSKVKANKQLTLNAGFAVILLITMLLTHGEFAMYSILAVGLCNSIMFPTIYSLTLNGLGKHTETGGGILCTFSVGAAIIPLLQATTADKLNIHYSFIIPLACYLYVFYFALFGYKAKTNYLFSKSKFIQKSNI